MANNENYPKIALGTWSWGASNVLILSINDKSIQS